MVKLTIVHGNGDVVVEEHSHIGFALARAEHLENRRHGDEKRLEARFDWSSVKDSIRQYGTGYHYVMMEEVKRG
jgi:hypothetical protein